MLGELETSTETRMPTSQKKNDLLENQDTNKNDFEIIALEKF